MKKDISIKPVNKKCFIYARTACKEQVGMDRQIEQQIRICSDYAKKNNFQVIKIYKDSGISGNSTYRPKFTKMLDRCKMGKADSFIVSSTDRMTRNSGEYFELRKYLAKVGISYYSATNNNSPEEHLMDGILASIASYERRLRDRNKLKINNFNFI